MSWDLTAEIIEAMHWQGHIPTPGTVFPKLNGAPIDERAFMSQYSENSRRDRTMTTKFCQSCGESNQFDSVYCTSCGTRLSASSHSPSPQYRPESPGFSCVFCRTTAPPTTNRKISTTGWVIFVVLLLVDFLLSPLALLIKEEYRVCSRCGMRLGEV